MSILNVGELRRTVEAMACYRCLWTEAHRMVQEGLPQNAAVWKKIRQIAEREITRLEEQVAAFLNDPSYHFPRIERR